MFQKFKFALKYVANSDYYHFLIILKIHDAEYMEWWQRVCKGHAAIRTIEIKIIKS